MPFKDKETRLAYHRKYNSTHPRPRTEHDREISRKRSRAEVHSRRQIINAGKPPV